MKTYEIPKHVQQRIAKGLALVKELSGDREHWEERDFINVAVDMYIIELEGRMKKMDDAARMIGGAS